MTRNSKTSSMTKTTEEEEEEEEDDDEDDEDEDEEEPELLELDPPILSSAPRASRRMRPSTPRRR